MSLISFDKILSIIQTILKVLTAAVKTLNPESETIDDDD